MAEIFSDMSQDVRMIFKILKKLNNPWIRVVPDIESLWHTVDPPKDGEFSMLFFKVRPVLIPGSQKLRQSLRTKPTNEISVNFFIHIPDFFPHISGKDFF